MTTPVPFGRTLAFAERTLTAVLRQHLAAITQVAADGLASAGQSPSRRS